jgi:hypothetical protein
VRIRAGTRCSLSPSTQRHFFHSSFSEASSHVILPFLRHAVVLRQTVYFNELRLNVTLDRYFLKIAKNKFCKMKIKNFQFFFVIHLWTLLDIRENVTRYANALRNVTRYA